MFLYHSEHLAYFSSVLLGVNLLIGTDNGLYLLDRSGNDKGREIHSSANNLAMYFFGVAT